MEYEDGDTEFLDPPEALGVGHYDDDWGVAATYWPDLKQALKAVRQQYGSSMRIELARAQGSPHRPPLVLLE